LLSEHYFIRSDNANIINKTIIHATNLPGAGLNNIMISNCNNNEMIPLLLPGNCSRKTNTHYNINRKHIYIFAGGYDKIL